MGRATSSGYLVDGFVPFVALPDVGALWKFVKVTNRLNNLSCLAVVLDVGPGNRHDEAYVFDHDRPAMASGLGISLGGRVWADLEMAEKGEREIEWEFVVL